MNDTFVSKTFLGAYNICLKQTSMDTLQATIYHEYNPNCMKHYYNPLCVYNSLAYSATCAFNFQ